MTTVLLVRHARCAQTADVLLGRTDDACLDEAGERQARVLGHRIARHREVMIESSPRLRARRTAAAIAERNATGYRTDPALDELDYGRWSGRSFASLTDDPQWRRWNAERARASPPGGETMLCVQRRAVRYVEGLRTRCSKGTVVVVTHAEVIRATLLFYLDRSLDDWSELAIHPASISTLELSRFVGVTAMDECPSP